MGIIKKLLPLLFLPLLLGATFYVDGGCTNNGDGTGPDCAASPGGVGPFNILDDGANQLIKNNLSAGDILDIRGAHSITTDHTSSANHKNGAAFDGNYYQRWLKMTMSPASAAFIRAHGWTGVGTGENPIIYGTRCPHPAGCSNCDATTCTGSWTQCTVCNSGTCNGVPGTCTDTWFTTDDGTAGAGFQAGSAANVTWAVSATGPPVYMVAAEANLATAHTFATSRCSLQTWRPCPNGNSDCSPSTRYGTCTANAASEVQGWNNGTGTLFVHWGPGGPPAKPYVSYNTSVNTSFDFQNAANFITVQGITILDHTEASIYFGSGGNNALTDVTIFYGMNGLTANGNVRAITADSGGTPLTIQDSEFAYTADEGIHVKGACKNSVCTAAATPCACCTGNGTGTCTGPIALSYLRDNVHNQGDGSVFGVLTNSTPSGILLGDDSNTNNNSDYTGTVIDGVLIHDGVKTSSNAYPLRIETASNWILRNSFIYNESNSGATCITMGQAASCNTSCSTDNAQIYNNLFVGCQVGGMEFFSGTGGTASGNKIYNNTFADNGSTQCGAVVCTSTFTGAVASDIFRNNIFFSSGANNIKQMNWGKVDTTNLFEFNLVSTGASPAATWNGAHVSGGPDYTCAQLGNIAASDIANCPSPAFVNPGANNYAILTSSPAKDAGTSTGMPAGRTTDICNSLAGAQGFPSYNHCVGIVNAVWDIGMWEFKAQLRRRLPYLPTLPSLPNTSHP